MTDGTTVVPIQHSSPYRASETQALAAEIAKCLKLVAPSSMTAEHQTVWLHAAVDALTDIRASEVAAISAELRRTVTRPAQIVPEIARLVSEKRRASVRAEDESGDTKAARLQAVCDQANAHARSIGRTDIHWSVKNGETVCETR